MGIDSNKEAYQMMKNTLGSIENRFREAYNKGYKDGLRDGASQVTAKLVSKILEETEADTPQTDYPCNTCANKGDHDGKCRNCIAESEAFRWKTPSNYEPQTDLSTEEFVEGMKNLKMEVKQTDCEACELDGKADVCKICRVSNYEPQTDCGWK